MLFCIVHNDFKNHDAFKIVYSLFLYFNNLMNVITGGQLVTEATWGQILSSALSDA